MKGTGWRVRGESVGGESEVSLWIESQGLVCGWRVRGESVGGE